MARDGERLRDFKRVDLCVKGAGMPPPYASDVEIERIGLGLLGRTLPKAQWTHAAHFAATLWLMRHRPDLGLAKNLPGVIRGYNLASGVQNTDSGGYHETITQASIRAARAFLDRFPPDEPLLAIIEALMNSPLGDKAWLRAYWTDQRLFSVEARLTWLEPDIQPLPF